MFTERDKKLVEELLQCQQGKSECFDSAPSTLIVFNWKSSSHHRNESYAELKIKVRD